MSKTNGIMPKKKIVIITVSVILLLLFLFRNKIFLPMGEQVKFSVELPKEMETSPLKVMYRSEICKASKPRSDGGSYKVPGYYYKEVIPSGSRDVNKYNIPLNGWGGCLWKLSNLIIETSYSNSLKYNANKIIGTGLIFVFDNNLPQLYHGPYEYSEGDEIFYGDVVMTKNYFPWYSYNIKQNSNVLWTYGGGVYSTYKVINTKSISLAFKSNPGVIVHSEWPVNNKEREFTKYSYPDGSVIVSRDEKPDYERLIHIKEKTNK
ncbi:hypothetical protein [Brenneria goodwinii]|uniref:Uncharacterized protein n=1 Tax=Brenneria goodwinii TaxID=1109412 RepID=A0A0G4JYA5_9GAMM|nr:hypothetical protein [Brenneria goodwinii]CPR18721.1 hypothetical protein BN1221_03366 [Brenneria goodwinii]